MKKKSINQLIKSFLVCLISVVVVVGPAYSNPEEVTLVGEINDTHQLVADGEIFDIDDTPLGDDLAENYISAKVKVKGTLREGEELKIITVKWFQVVEE